MIRRRGSVSPKRVLYLLILVALVFATGCTGINRLREAQEAFNEAAALENAIRIDGTQSANVTMAGLSSVRSGYTSALMSLEKIEAKDVQKLKQDHLWGNVLTLKALAQWRLDLHDESLATAEEAKRNMPDQLFPRDRALLEALPGLIKIDQAYEKIQNPRLSFDQSFKEVNILLAGDLGAVKDLDRARQVVEKDHPIQIYLIQSQLAAHRNLMNAYFKFKNERIPNDDPRREDAKQQLKELCRLLEKINPADSKRLCDYWAELVQLKGSQ